MYVAILLNLERLWRIVKWSVFLVVIIVCTFTLTQIKTTESIILEMEHVVSGDMTLLDQTVAQMGLPVESMELEMNKHQLRDLITRVLKEAELYSEEAIDLLMLTAATESELGEYIRQVKGPALGIFQMEPATQKDIIWNYLRFKRDLYMLSRHMLATDRSSDPDSHQELETNLRYAIIMARIHYLRVAEPLPKRVYLYADTAKLLHPMYIEELAQYWKKYYNTELGAGTVDKAIQKFNFHVGPAV